MATKKIKIEITVEEEFETDTIDSLMKWYYSDEIPMDKLTINGKKAKLPVGSIVNYKGVDYVGV